jgi:hypothetical protein
MSHRNWREICGDLSREKNSERFQRLMYELLEALDDYERKRERDQQLQDLESLLTDSTLE